MVAVSVLLALLAAYAALELAGRIAGTESRRKLFWLIGGATAMGLGIWAMHYVGMLAFILPVSVLYHYPTVLLSLLAAIAASAVALLTVGRERMGTASYLVGSLVMGLGIAGMHYLGMDAMRLPAMMEYRWGRVAVSVVLAVVISLVALMLAFQVRQDEKASRRKLLSALVMGSAIPTMHYTGMWAVVFRKSNAPFGTEHAVGITAVGTLAIIVISCLMLLLATAVALIDQKMSVERARTEAAREGEARFHLLSEVIPQIVWTSLPDGHLDYCNRHFFETTGIPEGGDLWLKWEQALHPDDLPLTKDLWDRARRGGDVFELDCRLRTADGGFRWYLVRATPVRDGAGMILKWYGSCTDIEDQKYQQQALEQQIQKRTEELAEANLRLQSEVIERDRARKALDEQSDRMVRDLATRTERATLLAKMGELLQSCMSKDEVFAAAIGFAPKIFPNSRGAVALLNSGRDLAEITGSWLDCVLPVPAFEPAACWALRTGNPHLVMARDNTSRCAHARDVDHTYLCVPILAQGETLGILHFQATDEVPTLADSELSLKTTFAAQVGLSVANIRLREALRAQSIKDPLTGLYNRRYLSEMLEREIRRAVRSELPLSLLMLDLDHFKSFNDTYGHDAGDTVLRETANFLIKSVRVEDIVCRVGGEEFIVILPTADLGTAHARGERIRTKLREMTVMHQGRSLGMITISVGVATLPLHGTTQKELQDAADAALYRAKQGGRDRVVDAEAVISAQAVAAELA